MSEIFVQISKYIILILFFGYCYASFAVLRKNVSIKEQGVMQWLQRGTMYGIHLIGYLCLYRKPEDVQILGFYLLQVTVITAILFLYRGIYKKHSIQLLHHMCMFVVISMIILTRLSFGQAFRQFVFLCVGMVFMCLIPWFMKKFAAFPKGVVIYAVVGILLLLLVVLIGASSYGAKLHLSIGSFSFQPSEFVKLLFVFFLAAMLYQRNTFKRLILTSLIAAVFVLLLVAARDLGGALLYFTAYLILVYVSSEKVRYLVAGFFAMGAAAVTGYFLFSHVRTRVFAWLNPLADPDNKGYQICQSLFGIGSGGWFGFGIGEGMPSKIPIVEKDFIFSAISEEFGALFAIGVILLCVCVFFLLIDTARKAENQFWGYVAIGFATFYATQVILTIGGAIKFIPSTGVTLPLVSCGGSSLFTTLMMLGVIQGIHMWHVPLGNVHGTQELQDKENTETKLQNGMSDKGVPYRVVLGMVGTIFAAMLLYFLYFMAFERQDFIENDYNRRQVLFEEDVTCGKLLTADGFVIAETVLEGSEEVRHYPYGNLFSHVTGYAGNEKTGLEKVYHFPLVRSHAFWGEQLLHQLTGVKQDGDNVKTTLRYDLQKAAYDAMGEYHGAAVVLEPATGKVLALVSKPDYDPNTVLENWAELEEGSSLFNRGTQGAYVPGSVFKIYTALAYMRCYPKTYQEYRYTCTGEITLHGKTIHCAKGRAHGEVTLSEAFAKSCNTAFVNMINTMDLQVLQDTCDSVLFHKPLPVAIESEKSIFRILEEPYDAIRMDTLIGQGNTTLSPFHMALLCSAICNDGIAMRPEFMECVENNKGVVQKTSTPRMYEQLLTKEEADTLASFMRAAVEDGTAMALREKFYQAYGKTGTAETDNDGHQNNGWFVGFAEYEGQKIAVAIVLENAGSGSADALPVAEVIFDTYFR